MCEYYGQLMGGPDGGNYVTTSQETIPVVSTTEMRLNGEDPNKDVTIIVSNGEYVWNEVDKCFVWHFRYNQIFTKKVERV